MVKNTLFLIRNLPNDKKEEVNDILYGDKKKDKKSDIQILF